MKIHCVGPGSIGSLVCFHLKPIVPITLLLRRPQIQHRRSPPSLSIQIERDSLTKTESGFEYEFLNKQSQGTIDSLLVTTKAHQVLNSIKPITHRLSADSTVILLHNGLGVLEELIQECFPDEISRPSFILGTTSHGVYRSDSNPKEENKNIHGSFCHSGMGDIKLGVLPSSKVIEGIQNLGNQTHWYHDERPRGSSSSRLETLKIDLNQNPILNPSLRTTPNLSTHLPYLNPATHSLHHTLSALLHPSVVSQLKTKWLGMPDFQTSALIKLTVNATINPISALLETRNSALLGRKEFEELSRNICKEASSVFEAQSTRSIKVHESLSTENLKRVVEEILKATSNNISSMCSDIRLMNSRKLAQRKRNSKDRIKLIETLTKPIKTKRNKSKVKKNEEEQQQQQKEEEEEEDQRLTEIDYINGYICKLGNKYNIPTPINQTVSELIKLKCLMIRSNEILPKIKKINFS